MKKKQRTVSKNRATTEEGREAQSNMDLLGAYASDDEETEQPEVTVDKMEEDVEITLASSSKKRKSIESNEPTQRKTEAIKEPPLKKQQQEPTQKKVALPKPKLDGKVEGTIDRPYSVSASPKVPTQRNPPSTSSSPRAHSPVRNSASLVPPQLRRGKPNVVTEEIVSYDKGNT